MKKILITGSNGLLGQTLTELICSTNRAMLYATSKGADRYTGPGEYHYHEMDLLNFKQTESVVESIKPDVIINTAAMTNVDTCHIERDMCWDLNVRAVENLVAISERLSIHLIHLSTDFVFDGTAGPYAEDDSPNPVSFYGESKYEAEEIISRSKANWAIVRTILVYGITANMSRSNIVLWAKSALEKGEKINVVNDQWRMPTLALDLAEGCLLIAEQEGRGIFHISGKDMMTVYELVQKVAGFYKLDASLAKPISSESLNQEARRPLKTGFILDKAIQSLGYNPHSFGEGLVIMDRNMRTMQGI
jgi:dTDP-4-dehydrorhamnose reductase